MDNKTLKYEDAIARLEQIISRIERGEMSLDSVAAEMKQAKALVTLCRNRLTKTEAELKAITAEE